MEREFTHVIHTFDPHTPEEAAAGSEGPVDVDKRRGEAVKVGVQRRGKGLHPDAEPLLEQLKHRGAGGSLRRGERGESLSRGRGEQVGGGRRPERG